MKKSEPTKKKIILKELGKVLVLYGVFFIFAVVILAVGVSCALHPSSRTSSQDLFCLFGSNSFGVIFFFGYPIIPLILYSLLRIGKGCSWKKVGISSIIILIVSVGMFVINNMLF